MIKTQSQASKPFTLSVLTTTLAFTIIHYPTMVWAQSTANSNSSSNAATNHTLLSELTQSAWQKQADYLTRDSQLKLVNTKTQMNKRLTPEAGTVELGTNRASQGGRGYELAYSTPLWLRNERALSTQQIASEAQGIDAKLNLSKLRVAGQVRELYWAWRISRSDVQYAAQQADSAAQLQNDVRKRLAAGDMTAADLKQAEIAHFSSLIALSEAQNNEKITRSQLVAFTSVDVNDQALIAAKEVLHASEPTDVSTKPNLEQHPVIVNIVSQISQQLLAKDLAVLQARARPEVTIGAGRDKGASGEQFQTNVRVGVKFALGSADNRTLAQQTVQTRIDELRAEQIVETQKLNAEHNIAAQRLKAVEQHLELAQKRSNAAGVLLSMIQKAFSLGEFDLPTRIRTAADANESRRQLAKTMLEKDAAISAYKQALGILPVGLLP